MTHSWTILIWLNNEKMLVPALFCGLYCYFKVDLIRSCGVKKSEEDEAIYTGLCFRVLPVQAQSAQCISFLSFTVVCSFTPNSPVSTTQLSLSHSEAHHRQHSVNLSINSLQSLEATHQPFIYLLHPSSHPDLQLKESGLSWLWWNTGGCLELTDSHNKKEMELRVTAETGWGLTVALHCFTLVMQFRWSPHSFCYDCVCQMQITVGSSGLFFQALTYKFLGFFCF